MAGPTPSPPTDDPADGAWRRLHPLTPWLRSWVAVGAFAALAYNLLKDEAAGLLALWRFGGVL
ncbi:MAG: hypothetical protein LBH76_09655, partial [Propionibacteriaceae bacterium]|nr:hypothetical protein [Propionibacteriaceae bacterium]